MQAEQRFVQAVRPEVLDEEFDGPFVLVDRERGRVRAGEHVVRRLERAFGRRRLTGGIVDLAEHLGFGRPRHKGRS